MNISLYRMKRSLVHRCHVPTEWKKKKRQQWLESAPCVGFYNKIDIVERKMPVSHRKCSGWNVRNRHPSSNHEHTKKSLVFLKQSTSFVHSVVRCCVGRDSLTGHDARYFVRLANNAERGSKAFMEPQAFANFLQGARSPFPPHYLNAVPAGLLRSKSCG